MVKRIAQQLFDKYQRMKNERATTTLILKFDESLAERLGDRGGVRDVHALGEYALRVGSDHNLVGYRPLGENRAQATVRKVGLIDKGEGLVNLPDLLDNVFQRQGVEGSFGEVYVRERPSELRKRTLRDRKPNRVWRRADNDVESPTYTGSQ